MKKNRFFVLGMLAVLLTFGMVLAGCDNGSTGGGGGGNPTSPSTAYLNAKDWVCTSGDMGTGVTSLTMKFSGTNQWTETITGGSNNGKNIIGTYTVSGLTVTFTVTGGTFTGTESSYTGTFDATQATKVTVSSTGMVFNRQP